ncbi:MAG: nascent polypeptide-associated complex domain protein [Caudoviricetes sp.]|nr:MAG: nascent polypeptide-associated complex domain protein [Caudoviricetes sp.]
MSIRQLAKKYGVSTTTIQRVIKCDPEVTQIVTEKKEQNTADILSYMDSKKDIVCEILGKGLDVLNDEEKLREASPAQITTALGTLIDKWTMIGGGPKDDAAEDGLSRNLRELAERMESDGD